MNSVRGQDFRGWKLLDKLHDWDRLLAFYIFLGSSQLQHHFTTSVNSKNILEYIFGKKLCTAVDGNVTDFWLSTLVVKVFPQEVGSLGFKLALPRRNLNAHLCNGTSTPLLKGRESQKQPAGSRTLKGLAGVESPFIRWLLTPGTDSANRLVIIAPGWKCWIRERVIGFIRPGTWLWGE